LNELKSPVYIILAALNGADYLAEQLDSLIGQTEASWTLLIQDDGSSDDTVRIIQEYARKDHRIRVGVKGESGFGSALGNFSTLLINAFEQGAQYVFCCDQDDVWEPNKLELMLVQLKKTEGLEEAPCLIHHDLEVVNEALETIADSFIGLMQLQPSDEHIPQRLISRNEVTGCAMACNRALLEIALPVSDKAVMHDWWLALSAAYFGRLAFVPDQLVKYRQHGANAIGAKSFWHALNPFSNWIAGWRRGNSDFVESVEQARAFRGAMSDRFDKSSETFVALDLYCELVAATRLQRLKTLRQCGLWRSHWVLNIVMVMRMLLLPRVSDR
jgi:rhamnosyltransferase